MIIVGIDPGKSGGLAWRMNGRDLATAAMPDSVHDLCDLLTEIRKEDRDVLACVEEVGGYIGGPGAPGGAMFNFGRNFGEILGVCAALRIPVHLVRPQKWQKSLSLGTSTGMTKTEWKNKLKAKAQQLFPSTKLTLATSDAALIYYAAEAGLIK